tara:strand:- start:644 stop:1351 length:708 start_codon:yes stop_codon:yes gene_type:complete
METKFIDRLLNSGSTIEFVIIFIFLAVLTFFKKRILNFVRTVISNFSLSIEYKSEIDRIKGLRHHDIFRSIERVRIVTNKHKFYHREGLDVTKSAMFKDFMTFKLDAIKHHFTALIHKAAVANDNDHVKALCFDAVTETSTEYLNKTKIHFLESGISGKDADYVIDLFERWRLETITSVQHRINSVFSSKFHTTRYENLLAVLELISMAIDLIPKDGIGAFESFNGKFKNIEYKK